MAKEIRLSWNEAREDVAGERFTFPKYTTQLLNLANQNAGGTRPAVVGQMTELIRKAPEKSFAAWKKWYSERHPDAVDHAVRKIGPMIRNLRTALDQIDEEMVREWVEDLVLVKTAEGLVIQEIILRELAEMEHLDWRLATTAEEARNIDGWVGDRPCSIKPESYLSMKPTVRDTIPGDVELIVYRKTDRYLYITRQPHS